MGNLKDIFSHISDNDLLLLLKQSNQLLKQISQPDSADLWLRTVVVHLLRTFTKNSNP